MSKHISLLGLKTLLEPLIHLIDKKAERPDWNENDPSSSSYIANRTHYEEIKEQRISASFTITNDQPAYNPFTISFVDGESYDIEWDGVKYNCVAYIAEGPNSPSVGNGTIAGVSGGNGEPFFITVFQGQVMVFGENGHHTLSLVESLKTIHKIDPKYLPEMSLVGKEGTAAGAEIFNDYEHNAATGEYSHAEGYETKATGDYSHAEGMRTVAKSYYSHAEGYDTIASGAQSHAEGAYTESHGSNSHAEGFQTLAKGGSSHASGSYTCAFGEQSTAIGDSTKAFSPTSFVAGRGTISDGNYSAVFGSYNLNKKGSSESNRYAEDGVIQYSESISQYTIVRLINTHPSFDPEFGYVFNAYTTKKQKDLKVGDIYTHDAYIKNIEEDLGIQSEFAYTCSSFRVVTSVTSSKINSDLYRTIDMWDGKCNIITIGNGGGLNDRSNAHTLDWQGNAWYSGDVYVGSTSGTNKDEGSKKLATEEYVDAAINNIIAITSNRINEICGATIQLAEEVTY